ncbi:hypothetical protein CBR_g12459 [Chara braunii]|uniref:CCHC-type domain-containing protein n=1 Tax=Chara braunii TaxID=69332 RepID=A0A388JSF5_CHABU|nr:hypothetical protein CBR_g12459 [Chara braunii]|eukprot:GBG60721.1 hypothetical protein CBR_g12459 [Chara braunii]
MAGYSDPRDYGHGDQRGYGSDQRDYHGDRSSYDRRPRRMVTCYNCDEQGHYGNQCPHPHRQNNSRPWTSSDSQRGKSASPRQFPRHTSSSDSIHSTVAEIGKSLAAVCQYVENEQQKKAAKECKKMEKKEVEERAEIERRERELKKKKKEDKARKEAELVKEINKNLDLRVAVQVAQPVSSGSESSASSSKTEELSNRMRNLWHCINEKRKRGEEPVFEDSPPNGMELPPKRTLRKMGKPVNLTARITRSKAKKNSTTPRKTPASIRKKEIRASIGVIGRLKFEKQVMQELKNLDALVPQNVCRDEGIPYNGKFEAIFDIVAHRTKVAYGTDEEEDTESTHEKQADDKAEGEEQHVVE